MLWHIVNTGDDDGAFKQYIDAIKSAYFPFEKLELKNNSPKIDDISSNEKPSQMEQKFENSLEKIIADLSKNKQYYQVFNEQKMEKLEFPFVDRFHQFFLKRKWAFPPTFYQEEIYRKDLFTLYPPQENNKIDYSRNHSKNYGHYNHFINVIAALARLINYFQYAENIQCLFEGYPQKTSEGESNSKPQSKVPFFYQSLAYKDDNSDYKFPNFRTFKLMLTAFYHDIGKTIVDPRHGMEGKIILGSHDSTSRYQLAQITNKYRINFERDDLLFIAQLINFHDSYGTLSTGEDGYEQLISIIEMVKRYSSYITSKQNNDQIVTGSKLKIIKYAQRNLFDLWLLNLADILVSLEHKHELQNGGDGDLETKKINWMNKNDAEKYIQDFLQLNTPSNNISPENIFFQRERNVLIHDLKISFQMLDKHHQKVHTDDTSGLQKIALDYSKRHTTERISRLIESSLWKPLNNYILDLDHLNYEYKYRLEKILGNKRSEKVLQNISIYRKLVNNSNKVIELITSYSQTHLNSTIVRSIKSVANFPDFCNRLAYIGKMDYSLGFFGKIADRACQRLVCQIIDEQTTIPLNTWLAEKIPQKEEYNKKDEESNKALQYWYKLQAQYFIDNYISIVVQIFSYLLFREDFIEKFRHLEFYNAGGERLTKEKIDKILNLEGPFMAKRTIQFVLDTITMY